MKTIFRMVTSVVSLSLLMVLSVQAGDKNAAMSAALTELAAYQGQEKKVEDNLKNFDTLDFEVFTGQQWGRLHESRITSYNVCYTKLLRSA